MYDAYWSLLLNKALRKQTSTKTESISPDLPTTNEPVRLTLETEDNAPPDDAVSQTRVAYAQYAVMPFAWQATYWPQPGWQTTGNKLNAMNWYVYEAKHWRGIKARAKLQATKKYLIQQQGSKKPGPTVALQRIPMPKIYFFIIFIICAALLWIEKKSGSS